ncbi:MAG: prepilin peptidase [Patescibacteria group bacterium]
MIIYLLIFILGVCVGSFLNVVIFRLHSGEKIVNSRSHCSHCQKTLGARELIPLLSFVIQGGRCRHCRKKISWQYPLVELVTGLLWLLAAYRLAGVYPQLLLVDFHLGLFWLRDAFFVAILVVVFVYDLKWLLILDRVMIVGIIGAVIFNLFLGVGLWSLAIGALVGLGFFALQFFVSRGRWIGGGDLRLGFLLGLMVGWPNIITALFLSYIVGAIVSVLLLIFKKKNFNSAIPFGTFLSVGAVITLFWGERIINWYLSLF